MNRSSTLTHQRPAVNSQRSRWPTVGGLTNLDQVNLHADD